jgi:nicotinamidase-related amidase
MLITSSTSALLLIDFQERLVPSVKSSGQILQNARRLAQAAQWLGVRLLYSEQYPKGLGPTLAPLQELLKPAARFEKRSFGLLAESTETREHFYQLKESGIRQIAVCGVEAHICVLQTALQLQAEGFEVYLVQDAVASRNKKDAKTALHRMIQAGIHPVNTEMVLFEWLASAAHPRFKEVQALILEPRDSDLEEDDDGEEHNRESEEDASERSEADDKQRFRVNRTETPSPTAAGSPASR